MAKIVTQEHFEEVLNEFPTLFVTEEQMEKILGTVNSYLLRQIKNVPCTGKRKNNWHMTSFAYTRGITKHHYEEFYNQQIAQGMYYTDKSFRKLMKDILPNTKVVIEKMAIQGNSISLTGWFNRVIYILLHACFTAMQTVGFEKMFDTEEMINFFDIKKFVDKTEVPEPYRGKDLSVVLKEMNKRVKGKNVYGILEGIPYNERTKFLFSCLHYYHFSNIEDLFTALRNATIYHDL